MATKEKISKLCKIIDADYLGGHKLRLTFNDGFKGSIDLEDFVNKGVFRPLRDTDKFIQFGLIYGTIVWKPKGKELDIAPEYLYQKAYNAKKGKKKHGFNYFDESSWEDSRL